MRTSPSGPEPLIGILAGMGPDSTAPFLEMVVSECREQYGASRDEEFPPMIVLSWPTPFRPDRTPDHSALREAISRGLELLAVHEPAVIAMPCNTAHLYWDRLRDRTEAPLLNMVTAAVAELPEQMRRVALLATRATRDSGLYQAGLADRGKTAVIDEPLQRALDRALVAAKQSPAAGAEAWRSVESALDDMEFDGVLMACSDLTPLGEEDGRISRHAAVDSTRILARDLVRRWRSLANPGFRDAGHGNSRKMNERM